MLSLILHLIELPKTNIVWNLHNSICKRALITRAHSTATTRKFSLCHKFDLIFSISQKHIPAHQHQPYKSTKKLFIQSFSCPAQKQQHTSGAVYGDENLFTNIVSIFCCSSFFISMKAHIDTQTYFCDINFMKFIFK